MEIEVKPLTLSAFFTPPQKSGLMCHTVFSTTISDAPFSYAGMHMPQASWPLYWSEFVIAVTRQLREMTSAGSFVLCCGVSLLWWGWCCREEKLISQCPERRERKTLFCGFAPFHPFVPSSATSNLSDGVDPPILGLSYNRPSSGHYQYSWPFSI